MSQRSRVTLDPRELDEVGELLQHLHHRHRVIASKLGALRPSLVLETRWAPDAEASTHLRRLLDQAELALAPLAAAFLADERSVRRTAQLARRAGEGPDRRLPPEQVRSLVDAVTGKSPEELAVLEATLLGGIGAVSGRFTATDPHPTRKDVRPERGGKVADVLAVARKQLGTDEKGDNLSPYGAWYGLNGQPWCAMFVSWVFARSGHPLPALQSDKGFASVATGAAELRDKGLLHSEPRVGSIWLHRGESPASDHTGIVTAVHEDGSFSTIEGNSSDTVAERRHPASEKASSYGFGWVL